MTYESLLYELKLVYTYFYGMFSSFIAHIKQYPVIVLSLMILVALPALYLVISFIGSLSDSSDDVVEQGYQIYRGFKIRQQKKKIKEQNEAFKREKINRQQRAYDIAQTFFANNPDRMSISIMGHKFFQDGFEHRNWSDTRRYYKNYNRVNPSSSSTQKSSAHIDVENDED